MTVQWQSPAILRVCILGNVQTHMWSLCNTRQNGEVFDMFELLCLLQGVGSGQVKVACSEMGCSFWAFHAFY